MRIIFAGTPETALPSLRALVEQGHEIVAVLTRPDAPAGRGKKLTASPVASLADQLGLPVLKPAKADDELVAQVRALDADVAAVVAFGMLLPQALLDALSTQRPQPALNTPPEEITEPFTMMLWGITTEQVQQWLCRVAAAKHR